MRFALDEDTIALRDGVATYLAKACPPAVVQAAFSGTPADELGAGLAEMGVLGLLAPASVGGLGADHVTMAAVLVELGRVAAPLPVAETAAVAVPILTAAGDAHDLLAGVVDGTVQVSVQSEVGVPFAGGADWFVLGSSLHARSSVTVTPLASVDRTRDLARVVASGPGTPLASTGPSPGLLGALAASATLLGLGRGMLDQTVAYVKERRQFGVPVGSFQAIKHKLADALVGLELAAPTIWAAAHAVDVGAPDAARSISLAKALVSDAATTTARAALQAHGAMGYTDDHHLHLWLKRTWCLAADHGTAPSHRARIAASLGLPPPDPSPPEGASHA